MLPDMDAVERIVTVVIAAAGMGCILRAVFIMRFRLPARATLTHDGYRRMRQARNAAVIVHERAPMPYTVEDGLAFTTADGRKMHVTVRRYAKPRERTQLVWYAPHRPETFSATGPLGWIGRAVVCLGAAALLFFT